MSPYLSSLTCSETLTLWYYVSLSISRGQLISPKQEEKTPVNRCEDYSRTLCGVQMSKCRSLTPPLSHPTLCPLGISSILMTFTSVLRLTISSTYLFTLVPDKMIWVSPSSQYPTSHMKSITPTSSPALSHLSVFPKDTNHSSC